MGNDFSAAAMLPNMKWQIKDLNKAQEHHLELVKVDDENVLLSVNVRYIPSGMTVLDFIENIMKDGIVIVNKE